MSSYRILRPSPKEVKLNNLNKNLKIAKIHPIQLKNATEQGVIFKTQQTLMYSDVSYPFLNETCLIQTL